MVSLSRGDLEKMNACLTESEVVRAQESMCASPYPSLRKVVCERRGHLLVLRGHVESFHLKQLAQETVRRLDRQHLIANDLTVD
jgi:hypothetical protein